MREREAAVGASMYSLSRTQQPTSFREIDRYETMLKKQKKAETVERV